MNILCISKYASPPKYGVGARLFYLAKEFVSSGHDVTFLASDSNHLANYPEIVKSPMIEKIDGINFVCFRNTKYVKTASIKRILSWFDFEKSLFLYPKKNLNKPDLIIVSSLSMLSIFYGYFLKLKFRIPLVFEVRDIWPLTLTAEANVSKYHPLTVFLAWVEKFAYKKADLIVGTMPRLDKHIQNILGQSRPFFCSPLGFDAQVMEERSKASYPELQKAFPNDKVVVGYAGSMGISNNLDAFIDCISELSDVKDVHFVLVGSGDLRGEYEEKLNGLENVTFLPRIKPSQVPYFLDLCDILYLSTHDSEVWNYGQSMNKVVEYMYAGKPIIASYSGFPSMINEAECGFFVPSNNKEELKDKISYVASLNSCDRYKLGLKGRTWILNHREYKELAKQYMDRLSTLLQGL